ncbi:mucin-2-like [Amphiprion ocellaris]|uniref:mucin-2-like n=1 Tax=Amphiprion ocellaris TaxID=80972 RepID=UPI000C314AFC|nr:mucin-2-like [Amphiprion ocellaris]
MDDQKTMHITIRKGRSLPQLERCATCCTDFHCPFCSSVLFHPTRLSKVRLHLENHFNRAVLHEGYTIHRCGLDCRARMHYNYIYCHSMLSRKRDFMKHLSLCKEKHPALTFTFRALKTSTIQTSTTSTSPAPKICTIPTSTTSTSPATRTSITAAPASPKIKSATILHVPTTPSGQTQRFCVIPIQQKNCCIYKVGGGSIYHVMPSVQHAASQTDAPETASVGTQLSMKTTESHKVHNSLRSTATQAKVPSRDCGVCTTTFPLDSPVLFLQPALIKRPSKRPRLSLTDEEEGPSECSLSGGV